MKELTLIEEQEMALETQQGQQPFGFKSVQLNSPKNSLLAPSMVSAFPLNVAELEDREVQLREKEEHLQELQEIEEHIQLSLRKKVKEIYKDNVIIQLRGAIHERMII